MALFIITEPLPKSTQHFPRAVLIKSKQLAVISTSGEIPFNILHNANCSGANVGQTLEGLILSLKHSLKQA